MNLTIHCIYDLFLILITRFSNGASIERVRVLEDVGGTIFGNFGFSTEECGSKRRL